MPKLAGSKKKGGGIRRVRKSKAPKKGGDVFNFMRKSGPRKKRIEGIKRDIATETALLKRYMAEIETEKARIEKEKSGGGAVAVLAGLELATKLYNNPIVKSVVSGSKTVGSFLFNRFKGKHNEISNLDNSIKVLSAHYWALKGANSKARSALAKLRSA